MSYCRWSSDNGKCDIYAYEAQDGFIIHVASRKVVGDPPVVDTRLLLQDKTEQYISQSKVRREWMDKAEYAPIGLPHDGETFVCQDIESFFEKMKELKEIGYHIPEGVIEGIAEEMNDSPTPPAKKNDMEEKAKCPVCGKGEVKKGHHICDECYESYKLFEEGQKMQWHKLNFDQLDLPKPLHTPPAE